MPIEGYDRDQRLFPVELENEEATNIRNQIVQQFNSNTVVSTKELRKVAKA